ncbi:hypothetical protein PLICRDRAFT_45329 [Plicaturopsis crispa FD-325 SS-3]|uniref:G-protein coupled receptors family 1 profile domain-containing protein n=1 Tax=Plicaturopsis crispa FD-325 SS-3 TaxID=944288 RepID=A0A0C9SYN7_PLICR|nr:hypothetical protein PLICRDRAFT_45329 [Plicaturopsis crispa FD-325 SS-3]
MAAAGPTGTAEIIFSSNGMQVLSAMIQFLGVSILAHCLSRRIYLAECSSISCIRQLPWTRLCVLAIFLDSWLFLFIGGILIFGVGLDIQNIACSLAIFSCIGFYASSKVFIYLFLLEKLHIVWSPISGVRRLKSPVYIVCAFTIVVYSAIIALLLVGRIHEFRPNGTCVIGLRPLASIPLVSYDLYVNILLTSLFLWPLFRSQHFNHKLRRVAMRTLVASGIALTTSTANILVLNLMHGKELGWVCLGSCGADVICNSVAIFWVTDRGVTPPTAAAAIRKVPVTLGIRRSLDSGMSPNMQMNHHSPEMAAINDRGAYFDHSTGSGPSRSNYSGDVPRVAYPGIRDHRPRLPSWFSSAHSDKPDTPEDMEVRVLSLFFLWCLYIRKKSWWLRASESC